MDKYTAFSGEVSIPMQIVEMKFYEKEDISLNPFQNLILEAIGDDCAVEQIAQATLLADHVIQAEIDQLSVQKLLEKRGEKFVLSDLSRDLLMVSRCVQNLNEEKRQVCINLITRSIEEYDPERFSDIRKENVLELQPTINGQEFDEISIEENINFFRKFLRTFDAMSEEQIERVLSSVYIEFANTGKQVYRIEHISRIPCLIGEEGKATSPSIWARGRVYRLEFSLGSAMPELDDTLLLSLPSLASAGLLSERGKKIAEAVETYQKDVPLTGYYDCVSGAMEFISPNNTAEKHKSHLELPPLHDLTERKVEEFLKKAYDRYALPPELTWKISRKEPEPYIVGGNLDELWGVDYE